MRPIELLLWDPGRAGGLRGLGTHPSLSLAAVQGAVQQGGTRF